MYLFFYWLYVVHFSTNGSFIWRIWKRKCLKMKALVIISVLSCCQMLNISVCQFHDICTHTHTRLTAVCPELPGWPGNRKVKPIWILLKQETVSGSGISWAIYKSAPRSRHITVPAPHHSVFYRLDALHVAQPTASKQWRHDIIGH